jgi:hypothetical protein
MYYDDLVDSNFNDESSTEWRLRIKEADYALKKLDKHYNKYTLPFNQKWTDGKFYKRITIENYGSAHRGSLIRNAVTGLRYDIFVGSKEESTLFKVTDATGYNGKKDPLTLFYDSPEQYEKHHFTNVSTESKQQWVKKALYVDTS